MPALPAPTTELQSSASSLQLPRQRQDLLLEHFWRHRSDVLEADNPVLVNDVGFGHAVNAVVNAHATIGIHDRKCVWVAVPGQPFQCVVTAILVIQAVDRNHALL